MTTRSVTVRVRHFDKWSPSKAVEKQLAGFGIVCTVKKHQQTTAAFLKFEDEAAKVRGIEILTTKKNRNGKRYISQDVPEAEYDAVQCAESSAQSSNDVTQNKRRRLDKPEGKKPECLADIIFPTWQIPYNHQLKKKHSKIQKTFAKFTKSLARTCRDVEFPWIKDKRLSPCLIEGILASPSETRYRNKDAFTIGLDEKKEPSVGYNAGNYSDGYRAIQSAKTCDLIPEIPREIAAKMELFLKTSEHVVYQKSDHSGVWRRLTVRTSSTNEVVLTFQIQSKELEKTALEKLKTDLVEYFTSNMKNINDKCNLTGILIQEYDGFSNASPPDLACTLLWGTDVIHERMNGLEFQISPNAFFQVNTPAAERLYEIVGQWSGCDEDTTLFDICCGTGTIGLTMAKKVKQLIGLELVESAINDARNNAIRNGITNSIFIGGKAERTLKEALRIYPSDNTVAIVDPPRAGLHKDVCYAIKKSSVRKLVYVSCNVTSCLQDLERLVRPSSKTRPGTPFKTVRALAVDLFPHTTHCEVVVLLERCSEDEVPYVKPIAKVMAEKRAAKKRKHKGREMANQRRAKQQKQSPTEQTDGPSEKPADTPQQSAPNSEQSTCISVQPPPSSVHPPSRSERPPSSSEQPPSSSEQPGSGSQQSHSSQSTDSSTPQATSLNSPPEASKETQGTRMKID